MSHFTSGVIGAEQRDELISEGMYIFALIRDKHFEFARDKSFIRDADGNVTEKRIPWTVEQEICIALALFVRQQAGVTM